MGEDENYSPTSCTKKCGINCGSIHGSRGSSTFLAEEGEASSDHARPEEGGVEPDEGRAENMRLPDDSEQEDDHRPSACETALRTKSTDFLRGSI